LLSQKAIVTKKIQERESRMLERRDWKGRGDGREGRNEERRERVNEGKGDEG
jgi:hypothetical protein